MILFVSARDFDCTAAEKMLREVSLKFFICTIHSLKLIMAFLTVLWKIVMITCPTSVRLHLKYTCNSNMSMMTLLTAAAGYDSSTTELAPHL